MSGRELKIGSESWLPGDGVLGGFIPLVLQSASRVAWTEVTAAEWPRCPLWARKNGIPGVKKVGVGQLA